MTEGECEMLGCPEIHGTTTVRDTEDEWRNVCDEHARPFQPPGQTRTRLQLGELKTGDEPPIVKPLTADEKLVWAALFAKEFSLKNPPSRCLVGENSDEEWEKWERQQTMSAIEVAGAGICRLREVAQAFADGWGEDADVNVWYRQMVNGA